MSDLETVNSTKLTITKLSKLQRHIIYELIVWGGWVTKDMLTLIAHRVADVYESPETEATKQQTQLSFETEMAVYHEARYLFLNGKPKKPELRDRNFDFSEFSDGGDREIPLSNRFKAAFYRSYKHLKKRRIIRKETLLFQYRESEERY